MKQGTSNVPFATDDPKENNLVLYACAKYKPTIVQNKIQNTN